MELLETLRDWRRRRHRHRTGRRNSQSVNHNPISFRYGQKRQVQGLLLLFSRRGWEEQRNKSNGTYQNVPQYDDRTLAEW